MSSNKIYAAIDLKSFYASVECAERGLDPMHTNLIVADPDRTEKTICLAVSPSLKSYGVSGRARLFEVIQQIDHCNAVRKRFAPNHTFRGKSFHNPDLKSDPALAIDYIIAPPQMARYIDYSTRIYSIYLKYVAPEDIHVYSIDEVFIDVTAYLRVSGLTARQFVQRMIKDIGETTKITATAGIGPNLYLCKVAMDIVAKHTAPDADGTRIAELDETAYRTLLWQHRPLTDFWRVGRGYAKKLEAHGIFTMGDIARCSVGTPGSRYSEALLYKLFGVNAELLIDHAWGWEPCTIADIKSYKPTSSSLGSGQVLQCPYPFEKAKLIVREMTDLLVLDLVEKNLATDQIVLTIGYDIENFSDPARRSAYSGAVSTDHYGRKLPKHARGSANLQCYTASTKQIIKAVMALYDRIADPNLLVRRIYLTANHIIDTQTAAAIAFEQMDFFSDPHKDPPDSEREKRLQQTELQIKKKYGKNAILKGMNLKAGATTVERNRQIGGHKA